ncbi:MAG: TetR/AcrR family transcriptional regulator [Clostridiales bacterium]|nr:TetR/AcrR family transcriptional regulator [Clostridiales bacterium]
MPKDTFFNLKEEKQQRILKAALHEISVHGYNKASVTRIVKDAGIATGSFYQYFEDLADVFVHIGHRAVKLKGQYMQQELEKTRSSKQIDMESFIRAMYRGGLRFGLEHEEYFRAAQSFLQLKDTELYNRMFAGVEFNEIYIWINQFVGEAVQRGELQQGITVALFLQLITGINTTIIEYLIAAKPGGEMSKEDLETLCDLGLHILLHGIRNSDN